MSSGKTVAGFLLDINMTLEECFSGIITNMNF